jgi:tetratricopeptide (TPR) repeat protein
VLSTEALAALPEQDRWLSRRAEAYDWISNPDAALADWKQTTVISPSNHGAWYKLGVGLRNINDLVGAQQAFEKSIQFDDQQHLEYYVALAEVYERLALLDEAKAMYRTAASLVPDNESIKQALERLEGTE